MILKTHLCRWQNRRKTKAPSCTTRTSGSYCCSWTWYCFKSLRFLKQMRSHGSRLTKSITNLEENPHVRLYDVADPSPCETDFCLMDCRVAKISPDSDIQDLAATDGQHNSFLRIQLLRIAGSNLFFHQGQFWCVHRQIWSPYQNPKKNQ